MSGMAGRLLIVALSFRRHGLAGIGAEFVRIRGAVEPIEGPVYVVKNRDDNEVKLTLTDNPLFVVIVPSKMATSSRACSSVPGMMQDNGVQRPSRSTSSRNRCAAPAKAITTGICCRRAR